MDKRTEFILQLKKYVQQDLVSPSVWMAEHEGDYSCIPALFIVPDNLSFEVEYDMSLIFGDNQHWAMPNGLNVCLMTEAIGRDS